MTVVKKIPATWECTWFDGGVIRSGTFIEFDIIPDLWDAKHDRRKPSASSGFAPDIDKPRFES